MLQLQGKEIDIFRISKLLVKYNIKASVSDQVITLEGKISDELLRQLCNSISICKVQNFSGKITSITQKKIVSNLDKPEPRQIQYKPIKLTRQDSMSVSQTIQNYNLVYSTVKRGEVYFCDFGEPYGSEQGRKRYAIIIQNDVANFYSPTTIVLPCTAEQKRRLPVHYHFVFSNENMLDYNEERIGSKQNVVMAEQIRTVDKIRLRKFLGTMTPEFMNKMQRIIDISLHLKRTERGTENVYIDETVDISEISKNLNMIQIQLLAKVNIEELFKIAQTTDSDEIKSKKILQLFNFDMKKNGVQYLFKAILISPKHTYFNLETLCESVSKNEYDIEKDEIKRLIVARVKEQFNFRKSPTIDFIRLVNSFLSKKEEEHNEEINF